MTEGKGKLTDEEFSARVKAGMARAAARRAAAKADAVLASVQDDVKAEAVADTARITAKAKIPDEDGEDSRQADAQQKKTREATAILLAFTTMKAVPPDEFLRRARSKPLTTYHLNSTIMGVRDWVQKVTELYGED
jgi:hypothetical protein